jgi:UDP-N-acetylmuramoylalanine--D-glutamate ligase
MTVQEKIRDRQIGVVGMARSGAAAALLAKRLGGKPFVSDHADTQLLKEPLAQLEHAAIPFETGGHTDRLLAADYLVVSPGVPLDIPVLQKARQKGLPLFSELEFASWACRAPMVAVTGSNGKTTTTTLIGEIFRAAGRAVEVCGNIGRPFSQSADTVPPDGVAVVEVSSFQLETIADFRPKVSMILNIQHDHLDRHGSLDAYRRIKYRIAENQGSEDYLVVNHDDPEILSEGIATSATVASFSIGLPNSSATWVKDGVLHFSHGGEGVAVVACDDIRIRGRHNLENAAAAVCATMLLGVGADTVGSVLKSFEGVEHRLEPVGTVAGVRFVNDSKATNVDSVCVALESLSGPVYLILGGRDKGSPYLPIAQAGGDKVRSILAIGEAREKIFNDLGQRYPIQFAETLAVAVQLAFEMASPGDTVLLSPGCASFDQFQNFEHRGKAFKSAVAALNHGNRSDESVANNTAR